MSNSVGRIDLDLAINQRGFNRQLGGLKGIAMKAGKAIADAFAIGSIFKIGKAFTDAGKRLNAAGTMVDAALPNMAQKVDEFAKSAGRLYGLSQTHAKGFVGRFATMATAMGYTEKQAYNMSTALTAMVGDVASFYALDHEDAYHKLTTVFTGETETLKSLGIVMSQNALQQYAMQSGISGTIQSMTELEKTTLRYNFLMDRLKLAQGDFVKYSHTWSLSITTIKLNWANFMATVGQGLITILLPLLQLLAKISNMLTIVGNKFKSWAERITGKKAHPVAQQMSGIASSSKGASAGIGKVGKSAGKTAKKLREAQRAIMGFDRVNKLASKMPSSAGGGGIGGGGGGGVGGLDEPISSQSDWKLIANKAKDSLKYSKKFEPLRKAFGKLGSAFAYLGRVMKKYGVYILNKILKPLGNWLIRKGLPKFVEFLAGAVRVLAGAFDILRPVIKYVWERLLQPFFKWLGNDVADILGWVGNALEKAGEQLEKWAEPFENIFETITNFSWGNIKDIVEAKVGDITMKVKGAVETVKDWWSSVRSGLASKVGIVKAKIRGVMDTAKNWWSGVRSAILKKLGTIKKKISASFSLSVSNIKNAINKGVIKKINSGLAKIPFVKIRIPYLAQGGYVKANTPQLAMIGDNKRYGEIVAPENKLKAMAESVASQSGNAELASILMMILQEIRNIDSDVYMDTDKVTDKIVKTLNQRTGVSGWNGIVV